MKKSFKICITIFSCLIICISALILISVIGTGKVIAYFSNFNYDTEFTEYQPLSKHYYNKLTDVEKIAYIAVLNSIRVHPEYIKVPELTNAEFNNVFFAVKNDNPDILCFADSCNMVTFWSASFLQMTYNDDVETCNRKTREMMLIADELVKEIPDGSDFERELILHDRLITHCDYNEADDSTNAYGFLVGKQAVCSGYSRAAMLLFNKIGIESFVVTGTGVSPTEGEVSHMWNIVFINDCAYHIDVTWNDPVSDSGDLLSHIYFNLSDESISLDHKNFYSGIVCDDTKYNYFNYIGTSYENYNKSIVREIGEKLIENIQDGTNFIEFEFKNQSAFDAALNSLVNNSALGSDIYLIMNLIAESDYDIDTGHVNFSMDNSRRYIRLSFDTIQK